MTCQLVPPIDDWTALPRLPGWVTSAVPESPETVAFLAGAGLAILDAILRDGSGVVPVRLLANRLALKASVATSKLEGRLAREADIRDAFHLAPPGEARGPDGDLLAFWRAAARLRLGGTGWQADIAALAGDSSKSWLDAALVEAAHTGPFAACRGLVTRVLVADDRAERMACLLSDVVLARALGWDTPLPLTALHIGRRDLLDGGVDRGILRSVQTAVPLAHDLARRAAALKAIAPKLRAKGSKAAVALFLSEDAVAPSAMLAPRIRGTAIPMTDRAARRFCDRLVELGVARELTGRATFRLFGIAP